MGRKKDSNRKPRPERIFATEARKCLMCLQSFPSRWPGERVCKRCKESMAWRSG